MGTLRIHLFGGVQVSRGEAPLPTFPTRRARDLFAYLAVHRTRSHLRTVLIDALWGTESESVGRRWLRTAVWRVRNTVDRDVPEDDHAVSVAGPAIAFNRAAGHWLDVEEFEQRLRLAGPATNGHSSDDRVRQLRAAIELYRGDALEGMYDEWCLFERERLCLTYVSALEELFQAEQERRDWNAALGVGQRLLRLEPLREHVHRGLMWCHLQRGDRAAALRQYEECARVLASELGVGPMQESVALYEAALGDLRSVPDPSPPGRSPGGRNGDAAPVKRAAAGRRRSDPLPCRSAARRTRRGAGEPARHPSQPLGELGPAPRGSP
jgi:DNA-binding SARP family transcriptional activator